jgi:hypothetical protein
MPAYVEKGDGRGGTYLHVLKLLTDPVKLPQSVVLGGLSLRGAPGEPCTL